MKQIVVSPEVLVRFRELAEATHRSEMEIINEALADYLATDSRYVALLAARVAAADRASFASEAEAALFLAKSSE